MRERAEGWAGRAGKGDIPEAAESSTCKGRGGQHILYISILVKRGGRTHKCEDEIVIFRSSVSLMVMKHLVGTKVLIWSQELTKCEIFDSHLSIYV